MTMHRRNSRSLHRGGPSTREEVNPNAYITNLTDCMLVLVLGLLVAIVAYYGIDLTESDAKSDEIVGIEVNLDEDDDGSVDSRYQQTGTVYHDEQTDSYYMLPD